MKRKYLLLALLLFLYCLPAAAQSFAINTDGSTANASSILDIKSTAKGILIPRMTMVNRNLIATPATGLMIYQTDNTPGFYYYDGAAWVSITSSSNSLWLQSGANIYNGNIGNVGIGTATPLALLQVKKGAVLFDSTIGTTPVSGAGTRMMWIPARAAFRSGSVSSDQWDDVNIGPNSIAAGNNTLAYAYYSTAMGNSTSATNFSSTALGDHSTASGYISTAMGNATIASGNNSTAMGSTTTASGYNSTAMGEISEASGYGSTAIGFGTEASALASTAMGSFTIASGFSSTATGQFTTASGANSTATGGGTIASGLVSTAMGANTIASGTFSTSVGAYLNSKSYAGFVTGLYNDSTNAANSGSINNLNRIFQVGNGTSDFSRSNAMTILQSGNTGIGTTTPVALLQVKKGAVLFDSTIGTTPVSGGGTRLMWIPAKAAFRAGAVVTTEWDDVNIGQSSVATGFGNKASGNYSTAIGSIGIASGDFSTAIGTFNSATGSGSVAMGVQNFPSGDKSVAIGDENFASGKSSIAMGHFANASAAYSNSIGLDLKSKSYGGFAAGLYNDTTNAADALVTNNLNRIFQIGNGTANTARDNAMTILQNGNTGIGTTTPIALLEVKRGAVLFDSTIGGTPMSGTGTRMMWIPAKSAIRAGYAFTTQWDDANIGTYSVAMGNNPTASANSSTAFGAGSIASGIGSTAIGNGPKATGSSATAIGVSAIASGTFGISIGNLSTASGDYSTAFGSTAIASGTYSTVIGLNTRSKSYGGVATGMYNDSSNAADPLAFNSLNRIFQVGNGTADNARDNAMTILQNGNVGIGTTTPVALLEVKRGAVLFDSTIGSTPVSGAGTRMMWVPAKAAFRAGSTIGSSWDNANIGQNSFAVGENTTASGGTSVAFGFGCAATNLYSTAMGYFTVASGFRSTGMGFATKASGDYSTSMGEQTIASGMSSTASGAYVKSKAYGSFATGVYNDSTNATDALAINSLNRIFQVGNGTADNARSNAMTILQNGNTGIGTTSPSTTLDVNGTTTTNGFQVGNGSVFAKMQSGSVTVGPSASGELVYTLTFPVAFASSIPKVFATARNEPSTSYSDAFSVSIKSITATTVTFNIQRTDINGSWAQQLRLDWFAVE